MRICLVSQDYPPEGGSGGTGTQTYTKAHGLASLGHDVHVLSHSSGERRHEYNDRAVHVIRIPGPDQFLRINTEAVRWLTYSSRVAAELDDLHADRSLDLVDFPEYGAEGFIWLLNRTNDAPPCTVHLQGPLVMLACALGWPEVNSELYRVGTFMEATCVRLADRVYSSSAVSADWAADRYGLDRRAIPVLHSGIDTQRFSPRDVEREDRPTVIFVGKIGPSKGADLLVEAACRVALRVPNLRVRFFGSVVGTWDQQLQRRAADAGFPGLVEFGGFLPRAAMGEQLSRAHVFAAPSPYEGGPGFVYLEAMACGLPVIGCSGSGIEEVIVDGANGVLIPPGDTDALAARLQDLLGDPTAADAMGRRARTWTLENADASAMVAKISAFLMSVQR